MTGARCHHERSEQSEQVRRSSESPLHNDSLGEAHRSSHMGSSRAARPHPFEGDAVPALWYREIPQARRSTVDSLPSGFSSVTQHFVQPMLAGMVVWATTIPLLVVVTSIAFGGAGAQRGNVVARELYHWRWSIATLWFTAVFLMIVARFWDYWSTLI